MGGPGSGNRLRCFSKATTDAYRQIDVRRLARMGALRPGYVSEYQWTVSGKVTGDIRLRAETDRVYLTYRTRSGAGRWRDESYPVELVYTRPHLGGSRPWFTCPADGCGRRVAVLHGGAIFACRHCHQLAYPSTREGATDRAIRQVEKIRTRLGWQAGILGEEREKPKWMRWRTFSDALDRHDAQRSLAIEGISRTLGLGAKTTARSVVESRRLG